jgi:uncharacterized phage infection (PIP) family protein YhgE
MAALIMQTPQQTQSSASETSDYLTKGLLNILQPAVSACDERIQAVYTSQEQLAQQIDHLHAELTAFNERQQSASVAPYIEKLTSSKNKLNAINSQLTRVVERLERIQLSLIPEEKKTRA